MQVRKNYCHYRADLTERHFVSATRVNSMADNKAAADVQLLPELIVLGPPTVFGAYEKEFNSRFRVLKPWESPLPVAQFLEGQAHNTRAALCSATVSVSATLLSILPSLRLIVTTSAGLNHIDLTECRHRGIAVAYAASLFSADAADFAVGLLLDILRKISTGNRFVKNGLWPDREPFPLGFKLGGKRVGIVGLGSIGFELAKRLEAFGCEISYHSRKEKPCVSYVFYKSIHELAAKSDILAICCALTEQTRHMINRDVMLALGKDGIIVNIARGGVVDERELVTCLERAEIGGAGLDVFEDEPRPPDELLELDNVVLTPHHAVLTQESNEDLFQLVVANLEAFFSNKPLISPVPEDYLPQ